MYPEKAIEIDRLMDQKKREIETHQSLINRYYQPASFKYFKEHHKKEIKKLEMEILELKNQRRNIIIDDALNTNDDE